MLRGFLVATVLLKFLRSRVSLVVCAEKAARSVSVSGGLVWALVRGQAVARLEGLMAGCVTEPFGSSGFQTPSDEVGGNFLVSDAVLDLYALALASVQV